MTNQLGLRALLTQPPHSVLLDARSHIHQYECGGLGKLIFMIHFPISWAMPLIGPHAH